jgi:hypothetical protein
MLEYIARRYAFGVFRVAGGKQWLGIKWDCHDGPSGRSNVDLGFKFKDCSWT